MLVLSRKFDERVKIGEKILIIVSAIRRKLVCLTIRAPEEIPIIRPDAKKKYREGNPGAKVAHLKSGSLVLGRKVNEKILIGNNIELTVLEIRKRKVLLGLQTKGSLSVILIDSKLGDPNSLGLDGRD